MSKLWMLSLAIVVALGSGCGDGDDGTGGDAGNPAEQGDGGGGTVDGGGDPGDAGGDPGDAGGDPGDGGGDPGDGGGDPVDPPPTSAFCMATCDAIQACFGGDDPVEDCHAECTADTADCTPADLQPFMDCAAAPSCDDLEACFEGIEPPACLDDGEDPTDPPDPMVPPLPACMTMCETIASCSEDFSVEYCTGECSSVNAMCTVDEVAMYMTCAAAADCMAMAECWQTLPEEVYTCFE